jgi:hydroxymethylpyrimidine/phosphomethylpyrimidine kinase
LAQDEYHVYPYQGSESATPKEQCLLPEVLYDTLDARRRTEANFLMQQYLRTTQNQPFSKELKEQGLQVRYAFDKKENKMRIETKLEQKTRLGYSLDTWDAAVICNFMRMYRVLDAISSAFRVLNAAAQAKKAEIRRECGNNHRKYQTCVKQMNY